MLLWERVYVATWRACCDVKRLEPSLIAGPDRESTQAFMEKKGRKLHRTLQAKSTAAESALR